DVFRWEAPDGTSVLAYIPYRYNDNLEPERLARELGEYKQKTGGLSHQLILYGVGDHGGGPTLEMLERWQEMQRVETFPAMRHTSPEAVLDRIPASRSELPTWRDELYLEYHRGTYTTHADMKRRNRSLEARLEAAEKLAVISGIPYPYGALEGAWKRVLFNQFHDILPGSGIRQIYEDAHAFYDQAEQLLDGSVARAIEALAEPKAGSLTVFNPLSAARGGRVELPALALGAVDAGPAHVEDEHGERHAVEADDGGRPFFLAPEVPGLGFRRFRVVAGRADVRSRELRAGRSWIENDRLRVTFSPSTGEIVGIYDKRARRDVLPASGRANRLQIFGDRPAVWDAWNISYTGEESVVRDVTLFRTEAGETAARAFIGRRFGASQFDQVIELRPGSPVIEIEHIVDWREEHRLAKLAFPVAVRADSAAFEIPYGVIRRSTSPRTPAERAKWEVSGQRWIDVSASDGSYGVSILNDGKYGYDVRGNVMRVTLLRAPMNPDSTADRGAHRFRIGIYPHVGSWEEARTPHIAAAFNAPLIAFPGAVRDDEPLAALDVDHVAITAIKRAEDDEESLVLRLVDVTGAGGPVRLRVKGGFGDTREADLLERPAQVPLSTEGGSILLSFRPWEIKTVIVRR
ncbi:MAG: alpha-mannosidase, partial [Gemmatimonadetes bacterium]|nr:alpha-mannosidase [Gemmatimonadota bacterium]